jgi:hypothetical protein
MRRLISRPPARKKVWGAGLVTAAALALTASLAFGQAAPAPDGGPPQALGPAPLVTTCGASISDTVVTDALPVTTNQTAPQPVPGATVPLNWDGASRCVKVLFTAESACGPTANPDFCYIQAFIDGQLMDPNGGGFMAFSSKSPTASAHAYEWIKRVPAGNHVVQLRWRVLNAGTQYWIDDSTLDVQTLQ